MLVERENKVKDWDGRTTLALANTIEKRNEQWNDLESNATRSTFGAISCLKARRRHSEATKSFRWGYIQTLIHLYIPEYVKKRSIRWDGVGVPLTERSMICGISVRVLAVKTGAKEDTIFHIYTCVIIRYLLL